MKFLETAWKIIVDSLFPLSKTEEELLSMSREEALAKLPPAPGYDASVVPIPGSRSVFAYKDERVSKLVWSIKYKHSAHCIRLGAYALYKHLPIAENLILVPIPISSRRRRERGYNQCELLIDEIMMFDAGKSLIHENKLLKRIQHASRQTLKSRADRLTGSKGIFEVDEDVAVRLKKAHAGKIKVIVIDDVVTTGSTMKEALDIIRAAGFGEVTGLSLAH